MPDLVGPPAEEIRSLFSSVSHGYDQANDFMTFGLVRLWRRRLVRWSHAKAGQAILDCATGTGDLAIEFKRVVGSGRVIGTDFCAAMLEHAPEKAKQKNLEVDFQIADVTQLPFSDRQFDVCSIAYGIRNVENPARALSEMARVVKPGGCVMVLETGENKMPFMNLYFRQVVPRIGGWVTGRREAYEYLNRSSSQFPSREAFVDLMRSTRRFSTIEYKSLMGGASFIYKGITR